MTCCSDCARQFRGFTISGEIVLRCCFVVPIVPADGYPHDRSPFHCSGRYLATPPPGHVARPALGSRKNWSRIQTGNIMACWPMGNWCRSSRFSAKAPPPSPASSPLSPPNRAKATAPVCWAIWWKPLNKWAFNCFGAMPAPVRYFFTKNLDLSQFLGHFGNMALSMCAWKGFFECHP